MIDKIFKYSFFLRIYFLTKDKLSKWFIYFLLILVTLYAHSEVIELSEVINDKSYVVWSYFVKNFLLILILGVFILNETKTFKVKNKPNLNHENLKIDNKNDIDEKNDDPFSNIRRKKTLSTYSDKILKDR